jgi:3'-phosphoadenosine 5'-phosphosulfate sulfotransferase (PAPS reductase)/FAD synthetase
LGKEIRVFSFGGGVQSVACLVLAAQEKIDYRTFVFCDVGEDTENPETHKYIKEYAAPFAEKHGIDFYKVMKQYKGQSITLWQKLMLESRSVDIPVRMSNGAPGRRNCTVEFKIKPIASFIKRMGATKQNRGIVGIGISTDEAHRAKPNRVSYLISEFPLLDLGLSRQDCKKLIADAGLPVPPKSACFFCPFQRKESWENLYSNKRELFNRSVDLENTLNARRKKLGKDSVWLTGYNMPLSEVVTGFHERQLSIWGAEEHSCGPFLCGS